MDTNPKQFVKTISKDDPIINSKRDDIGKDDDDPLSIGGASINFLGILLAIFSVFIPVISVFLERPLLQDKEVITNQNFKEDGY